MKKRIKENTNNELDVIRKELFDIRGIIRARFALSQKDYDSFNDKLDVISQKLSVYYNDTDKEIRKGRIQIVLFVIESILQLLVAIIGAKIFPGLSVFWKLYAIFMTSMLALCTFFTTQTIKSYQNGSKTEYNEERTKLEEIIDKCRLSLEKKRDNYECVQAKEVEVECTPDNLKELLQMYESENLEKDVELKLILRKNHKK